MAEDPAPPAGLGVHRRQVPDRSGLVVLSDLAAPIILGKTLNLDISHSWVHLAAIYAIITVLSNIGGWLPGYTECTELRHGAL